MRSPDFSELYERSAQHQSPDRNPVILITGMMGSQLVDQSTGNVVWGGFERSQVSLKSHEGVRAAALPMHEGVPLGELKDDLEGTQVLERLRLNVLGLPVELRAYRSLMTVMGVGGFQSRELGESGAIDYGDEHYTCFQFAYDWRRDFAENARLLHEFILEQREFVKQQNLERFGHTGEPVKFDLVTHSAGGLLARYYLRYGVADLPADGTLPDLTWAGAEQVEMALLVAPPNAGAAEAMVRLVEGQRWGLFTPTVEPAVIGTMPAAYQLLPRQRHGALITHRNGRRESLDPFDVELWMEMGWGLADPKQDYILQILLPEVSERSQRLTVVRDHIEKSLERARHFHAAIDRPAEPPPGLFLYLMAADARSTPAVLEAEPQTGDLRVASTEPGDGIVTRASALMDERVGGEWRPLLVSPIDWRGVQFFRAGHLGMTRTSEFTNNMLYLLLEKPRSHQVPFM